MQVTFVVLGFGVMIAVQLIENYTTGATAVTGTGVSSKFMSSSGPSDHQTTRRKIRPLYDITIRNESDD